MNLRCAHQHGFEGWFANEEDAQTQLSSGRIACPLCGDSAIVRLPSAPRLGRRSRADEAQQEAAASADAPARAPAMSVAEAQDHWNGLLREVLRKTEDVGERFAEEARDIHAGRAELRPIRGQASAEDAHSLREEGIQVLTLPLLEKTRLH